MSPARRPSVGGVLYGAVVVAVAVGLALAATGAWRTGMGVCGGALIAAGVGRVAIPERMSGLLRIRRRPADVVIMLAFGVALVVLATIVPDQP